MTKSFHPLKGFVDLFDQNLIQHHFVIDECNRLALLANYSPVQIPIVENIDTFSKQFAFANPNKTDFFILKNQSSSLVGNNILRPELTSGLIRAYLNNPLFCQKAATFFTSGPCFRYENPQKGRLRQFWQWNFEQLRTQTNGIKHSLAFLTRILKHFALDTQITFEINYLTTEKLQFFNQYLSQIEPQKRAQFCAECQNRFAKAGNLYRILDCKKCQNHFEKQLLVHDQLTPEQIKQFAEIQSWIKQFLPNGKIVLNPLLVRGLDYYRGFVFEVKFNDSALKWAQNTLIAGGEYYLKSFFKSKLTETGTGFGFAIGIERMVIALKSTNFFTRLLKIFALQKTILIGYLSKSDFVAAYNLQTLLNENNYIANVAENIRHFSDLLKHALALKVKYLIVFDKEYQTTKKLLCKKITPKWAPIQQFRLSIQEVLKFLYEAKL